MSFDPPREGRRFTLEEAEAILPDLREALARMGEARQTILRTGEQVKEAVAGNGGGETNREYQGAAEVLKAEVERISGEGIVLRDVESGLVDFPSERDGRMVYLCWRLGEDHVTHWHDPETGFAGRQPL
ncbi:MAG TPA: DUF2203 domain-containing protein [Actinomycetota bacterium]